MPAFVLVPATPNDLPQVAAVHYAALASDPAFRATFPRGASATSIAHLVQTFENDMDNDPTIFIMLVRDGMTKDIASYAIWHFYPSRNPEDIERDMLKDDFPLPADANVEPGLRLMQIGNRKRHEVMARQVGMGAPYAYLALLATSPSYQRQGAAAMLMDWGLERADDRRLPAYVEATPAGFGLYQRYGFQQVEILPLDLKPIDKEETYHFCMARPAKSED